METPEVVALYAFKSTANQHLKHKQFSQAQVYFSDILAKLDHAIQKIETQEDMEKLIKEIKIPALKNLSLCYLKLNENLLCIDKCQEILQIEPNCLKTLYRISKGFMNLKRYAEAQNYLKRGFAIDPNEQQIQRALSEIQSAKNSVHKSEQPCFLSLKNLISFVLYYPLLIFNFFLSLIFGEPKKQGQKRKTN